VPLQRHELAAVGQLALLRAHTGRRGRGPSRPIICWNSTGSAVDDEDSAARFQRRPDPGPEPCQSIVGDVRKPVGEHHHVIRRRRRLPAEQIGHDVFDVESCPGESFAVLLDHLR
jgi:hypothetical protein